MTKTISVAYATIHDYRTYITTGLLGASIALVIAYAASVYAVISHTVAIQKIQAAAVALGSTVDNLDSQYLQLSSSVTPESLSTYGFTQGKVSAYISRTPSLGSVARGGHEL